MTNRVVNSGVATFGGTTNINGPTAVGTGATVNMSSAQQTGQGRNGAVIGIVTVIAEEASAVRSSLGLEQVIIDSLRFDVGILKVHGKSVTVVATRTLTQGQESAAAAFHHLREHFNPTVFVLAGIAGGFHQDVQLGDVIVATRVICYDLRKETPSGTRYRGQERQAPAAIGHAVNEFFTAWGEPAKIQINETKKSKRTIRALNGPIGSGNSVIANRDSDILKYLARFNDKILAVDMEAAGFSQAYYEELTAADSPLGWLVIRGISDRADLKKNDDYHVLAAQHAALVLRELIPYLPLTPSTRAD